MLSSYNTNAENNRDSVGAYSKRRSLWQDSRRAAQQPWYARNGGGRAECLLEKMKQGYTEKPICPYLTHSLYTPPPLLLYCAFIAGTDAHAGSRPLLAYVDTEKPVGTAVVVIDYK